ncbi:MAG: hypothetical protein AB3N14_01585 [Flavobacteriaceae bacterium]
MKAKVITISADNWDQLNPQDANANVLVTCDDTTQWEATFYSYRNIISLAKKNSTSAELYFGQYFFAPNMLLVEEISQSSICDVVKFLIDEKREVFEKTFQKVDSKNEVSEGDEISRGRNGVTIVF